MDIKNLHIKKLSVHRQTPAGRSGPNSAWLKIVYAGFGLFIISIFFHIWLFISSGKTAAAPAPIVSPSVETINRTELNAVLSNYTARQSERASLARTDSLLKDPSK